MTPALFGQRPQRRLQLARGRRCRQQRSDHRKTQPCPAFMHRMRFVVAHCACPAVERNDRAYPHRTRVRKPQLLRIASLPQRACTPTDTGAMKRSTFTSVIDEPVSPKHASSDPGSVSASGGATN